MAYINGNRRISPLDINKNITIGVAFPLDEQLKNKLKVI